MSPHVRASLVCVCAAVVVVAGGSPSAEASPRSGSRRRWAARGCRARFASSPASTLRTDKAPQRVDFLVDQVPLASDTDGPPYEALWVDENPFERRELSARAVFESGPALTDTVVLDPMSVTEVTEVTSVALDTSVLNAKGQFVRGLTAVALHGLRERRSAGHRRGNPEA